MAQKVSYIGSKHKRVSNYVFNHFKIELKENNLLSFLHYMSNKQLNYINDTQECEWFGIYRQNCEHFTPHYLEIILSLVDMGNIDIKLGDEHHKMYIRYKNNQLKKQNKSNIYGKFIRKQ